MGTKKELQREEKKAVEQAQEVTRAGQTYYPLVDIWEAEDAIVLEADMPGVPKDAIRVDLEDDVLTIQGDVGLSGYEGLRPLYSEYNVGNYYRRFTLGEVVDQSAITASVNDGVLVVKLPKRAKATPRTISVQ